MMQPTMQMDEDWNTMDFTAGSVFQNIPQQFESTGDALQDATMKALTRDYSELVKRLEELFLSQELIKFNLDDIQFKADKGILTQTFMMDLNGKIDRIMLDNFTPALCIEAVKIIDGRCETEASGGITLSNIKEYAESGVTYISLGYLTHSVKALDISFKTKLKN